MNKKEFLTRWRNSKIHPLQFYRPVEESGIDWSDAFHYKVYIDGENKYLSFSFYTDTFYNKYVFDSHFSNWLIYGQDPDLISYSKEKQSEYQKLYENFNNRYFFIINPTIDGELVTKENFPDLFISRFDHNWENCTYEEFSSWGGISANPILHKIDEDNSNIIQKMSEHLTLYIDDFNITINYGDGNIVTYDPFSSYYPPIKKEKQIKINGEYKKLEYFNLHENVPSFKYQKAGVYDVFIKSKCLIALPIPSGCEKYSLLSYGRNNNLKKIIGLTWGSSLLDLPKDTSNLKNVVSVYCAFQHSRSKLLLEKNSRQDWEDILKNFMQSLPCIISAQQICQISDFENVPDYFLKNNKFLINVSYLFQDSPIKNVGDYACANLPFLFFSISEFNASYSTSQFLPLNELGDFGEGVFENDWSLTFSSSAVEVYPVFKEVKSNIFKNCYNLMYVYYFFDYAYNLRRIGSGIFENCYSLCGCCTYSFYYTPLLEEIGNDFFKNCYNLGYVSDLFHQCTLLKKLPEKLFYDLSWDYGRKWDFTLTNGPWKGGEVSFDNEGHIIGFNNCSSDSEGYAKELFNEVSQKYDFYTFPQITFPKDMFNKEFISKTKQQGKYIYYYYYWNWWTLDSDWRPNPNNPNFNSPITSTWRSVYTGYAPPIWMDGVLQDRRYSKPGLTDDGYRYNGFSVSDLGYKPQVFTPEWPPTTYIIMDPNWQNKNEILSPPFLPLMFEI